jgi:hypothetical protein
MCGFAGIFGEIDEHQLLNIEMKCVNPLEFI